MENKKGNHIKIIDELQKRPHLRVEIADIGYTVYLKPEQFVTKEDIENSIDFIKSFLGNRTEESLDANVKILMTVKTLLGRSGQVNITKK